ncbi:uncharacterized protein J5M81_014306 [Pluvialis apricaria]
MQDLPPNPLVLVPPVTGISSLQHSHLQDTERSCKKIAKKRFNEKVEQSAVTGRKAGSDKRTDQLHFTHDQSLLYLLLPDPPRFLPHPLHLCVPSSLHSHTGPCEHPAPAGAHAQPRAQTVLRAKLQLESLSREKGELEKWEMKERWICQDCVEKVKVEKQKIVPEFKQLQQYLEEQECLLLAQLGELEKQMKTRLKENAGKFSKQIIYLDGLMKEKVCQLLGDEALQVRSAETDLLRGRSEKGSRWELPCLWTSDTSQFLTYLPWLSL